MNVVPRIAGDVAPSDKWRIARANQAARGKLNAPIEIANARICGASWTGPTVSRVGTSFRARKYSDALSEAGAISFE